MIWYETYGGDDNEVGNSILLLSDDSYLLAGTTRSFPAEDMDAYIIKIDNSGNVIWENLYGGYGCDEALSIIETYDNKYIFCGVNHIAISDHDMWVVKIDSEGNEIWSKMIGNELYEDCKSIIQTTDDCFILTGQKDYIETSNQNVLLVKLNKEFYSEFNANPIIGQSPLEVNFFDESLGNPTIWEWDFDNDGFIDSNEQNPTYVYNEIGVYTVSLTISDSTLQDTQIKENYINVTQTGSQHSIISVETKLYQNYPNPFNPITTIEFSIQNNSKVDLSIFNIKGQKVKTLANNVFEKGNHTTIWNGDDDNGNSVSSGIYYYNLKVNNKTNIVKKCLLLK